MGGVPKLGGVPSDRRVLDWGCGGGGLLMYGQGWHSLGGGHKIRVGGHTRDPPPLLPPPPSHNMRPLPKFRVGQSDVDIKLSGDFIGQQHCLFRSRADPSGEGGGGGHPNLGGGP